MTWSDIFYKDQSIGVLKIDCKRAQTKASRRVQRLFGNPRKKWWWHGSDGNSRGGENQLNSGYILERGPVLDGLDRGCEEKEKESKDDQFLNVQLGWTIEDHFFALQEKQKVISYKDGEDGGGTGLEGVMTMWNLGYLQCSKRCYGIGRWRYLEFRDTWTECWNPWDWVSSPGLCKSKEKIKLWALGHTDI